MHKITIFKLHMFLPNIPRKKDLQMLVSFNTLNQINQTGTISHTSPFKQGKDVLSFGAMKKSAFKGFDLAAVNRFKAPIEKFNGQGEFEDWCIGKIEEIEDTESWPGKGEHTGRIRKMLIDGWIDNIEADYPEDFALILLVLESLTKDLKSTDDCVPPIYNKKTFEATKKELEEKLAVDKNLQFNFAETYKENLRKRFLRNKENYTGWVELKSKKRDPEHYALNLAKMLTLSHPNWCTQNAEGFRTLNQGAFHIYYENGKPQIGIRFSADGDIREIQGTENNGHIPVKHYKVIDKHIKEEDLKFAPFSNAETTFEDAKRANKGVENVLNSLDDEMKEAFKNLDAKKIYEHFGIRCKENEDGTMTISHYESPVYNITFADLGLDEAALFSKAKIKHIEGHALFDLSEVTDLGILESIGGSANFGRKIKSLKNVKKIGGNAVFKDSRIEDLGALESVGMHAKFTCLPNLKNLGKLKTIGGNAEFIMTGIKNADSLESVGMDFQAYYNRFESLKNLKEVGRKFEFKYNKTEKASDISSLEHIGSDLKITDLEYGRMKKYFKNVQIGGATEIEPWEPNPETWEYIDLMDQ